MILIEVLLCLLLLMTSSYRGKYIDKMKSKITIVYFISECTKSRTVACSAENPGTSPFTNAAMRSAMRS